MAVNEQCVVIQLILGKVSDRTRIIIKKIVHVFYMFSLHELLKVQV